MRNTTNPEANYGKQASVAERDCLLPTPDNRVLDQLSDENIYCGISISGDPTLDAYQDANVWLKQSENQIDS